MVAAFNTMLDTGGTDNSPGTSTNVDSLGPPCIRFKRADNPTIDSVAPCTIPASGTSYSRWKQIYLKCVTTAPSVQVDNVRLYTDAGGFGTGIAVKIGDQYPVHNSAATTGYDVADTDDQAMATGHTDITTSSDFFGKTVGAPATITISEAGSVIDALNETTNYAVLQMEVISTATPGDLGNETITWKYDEI